MDTLGDDKLNKLQAFLIRFFKFPGQGLALQQVCNKKKEYKTILNELSKLLILKKLSFTQAKPNIMAMNVHSK